MMIDDMMREFYHNDPTEPAVRWDDDGRLRRLGHLLVEIKLRQGILLVVIIVHVSILRRFVSAFRRHKLDSVLRWHFMFEHHFKQLPNQYWNETKISLVDIERDFFLFSSIN